MIFKGAFLLMSLMLISCGGMKNFARPIPLLGKKPLPRATRQGFPWDATLKRIMICRKAERDPPTHI